MKCPRCRKTMRREKYKDGYRYICPACNLVIGGKSGGQRSDMEERHGEETSD